MSAWTTNEGEIGIGPPEQRVGRRLWSVTAFAIAILLNAAEPDACLAPAFPHVIDPEERQVDSIPPAPPRISSIQVTRGRGPRSRGSGVWSTSSLDDLGRVTIALDNPTDNRTPPEDMGFEIQEISGIRPNGMKLPQAPIRARASSDGLVVTLSWIDGATDAQEPIAFSVALIAIDRGGNRSHPSATVHVTDPPAP